jgi:hypothetical protein
MGSTAMLEQAPNKAAARPLSEIVRHRANMFCQVLERRLRGGDKRRARICEGCYLGEDAWEFHCYLGDEEASLVIDERVFEDGNLSKAGDQEFAWLQEEAKRICSEFYSFEIVPHRNFSRLNPPSHSP